MALAPAWEPGVEEAAEPLRPPAPRRKELRALALTEVPLDSYASLPKASLEEGRPQRRRMPRLEHWRNERVIYERPRGSKAPEVAGVELNLGPRSEMDPPRQLACTALQSPFSTQEKVENPSELIGISTRELESRMFTLLSARPGHRPQTVKLPPGLGQIHIMDGAVRCAYEGDPAAAELRLATRDSTLLRDRLRPVLIAAAEPEEGEAAGTSDGSFARFLYVRIKAKLPAPEQPLVKATPKQSPRRPLKAERASPRPALQPLPPPAAQLEL